MYRSNNLKLYLGALLTLASLLVCTANGDDPLPELRAKWIWCQDQPVHLYNQTIIARKDFTVRDCRSALVRITADSYYRLSINGRWVNDGPARTWPEHYQYDIIDATSYLRPGENQVEVIARYYGVGDFHRIPQQAGLLVQIDITDSKARIQTIQSDRSWKVAEARGWIRETPKVSIQMEPAELFDAGASEKLKWSPAAVLFDTAAGPWKDLNPRDVALMTRQPRTFRSFQGANLVRAEGLNFCLPAVRLSNPGIVEANHTASASCGMATVIETPVQKTITLRTEGMRVAIDGKQNPDNRFDIAPGKHILVAFSQNLFGHDKEKALRFENPSAISLSNPLRPSHENPFVLIRLPQYAIATNDLIWIQFTQEFPSLRKLTDGFRATTDKILSSCTALESFHAGVSEAKIEVLPAKDMFVTDTFWQFTDRKVVGDASGLVQNPSGLIHENAEVTTVLPSSAGDVELLYDLGQQEVGYYDFELVSEAGVKIDIFGLEYISPDGRLQFSWGNRNGMRYITSAGVNRFTSLKRRSGRYLFITVRDHKAPVQIRHFRLIASTYPVDQQGSFSCSDARLDRIWNISTHTLQLCMEDTYTDCPLYEQTHWVGDARNESLLGYSAFGAYDLARRCIRITGQSLERFPITGCQTPSGWDTILPAWSFLWGISTWDYYFETGDREFLSSVYPAVIKNLKGAERFTNEQGLFSGPFWNMFDWSGSDQGPRTVIHNSMFAVGAVDAALHQAELLGKTADVDWLRGYRARLIKGINSTWDSQKNAYPDSIHDDGKPSDSTSQHTSFLGLLYGIVPTERREAAKRNLLSPPEKMVRIGSPFAALYLYEAYEQLGLDDQVVKEIYRNYLPMLEAGATTVWESFPTGTTGGGQWPTRSHCHAWSSAPTRFLNRIILGVKPTSPAARTIQISPRLSGLTWASGTTLTKAGPVKVSWKLEGRTLRVDYSAPGGAALEFVPNDTHQGFELIVNGKAFKV